MGSTSTIIRAALTLALIAMTGVTVWIGLMPPAGAIRPGPVLVTAIFPIVAAVLLQIRRPAGAALAMVAGLVGAFMALLMSTCFLCGVQPALTPEAIALAATAGFAFLLGAIELARAGFGWVAVAITVVVLVVANSLIAAAIVVVAYIGWLAIRRRRAGQVPE